MEIQIVEFFKSWSCKFCDVLFSFTNLLGEDLFFYLVFFMLYWAYRKEYVYKFALVYAVNSAFNVVFKKIVKRPRPIGATADGYSFPSGHSQSYSAVGTSLLYEANKNHYPAKKWLRIEFLIEVIVCGLLVAIGRMYFGQHYLTDVIAGLMFGVIVTVLVTYILDLIIERVKKNPKITLGKVLLCILPLVIVGYVVVACTNIFEDPEDLAKIYRIVGIYCAVVVSYFVDKKWIQYNPDDTIKNKMLKLGSGMATMIVLYVMFAKDANVNAFLPIYYFIIGIVGLIVLPWIFKTIKNPEEVKE